MDVPISGDRPARLLIRAPDGTVVEDSLPCEVRLDQQGGWWFSLEDPRAPGDRWASFPVFAGERPPPTGGLDLPGDTVVGPDDAAGLAPNSSDSFGGTTISPSSMPTPPRRPSPRPARAGRGGVGR